MAERVLDELDDSQPTPLRIKSEHAERLAETYDEPLLYLAVELLAANRRKWLHGKPETNGAQQVERHGLTRNQRAWLNDVADQ
ncbi:bifunctional adenosylcobinamide kinase/adenosylcobinamide-phosphate guanylyltransferase [Halohasta litorea]|uniref:Bifunctional adenosylcobinamide kinase/adenosylcobinamide-phosphate guanylyltransferase n=1 Tax=Halohasta litorea TaxID=869891 RepID=A0ABD6DBS8_9EURY|nr:bifunctional adenosylcobinamide kinase/adenosylcobinamide-phosphate guanylyltransferase [Halohasta litorea]